MLSGAATFGIANPSAYAMGCLIEDGHGNIGWAQGANFDTGTINDSTGILSSLKKTVYSALANGIISGSLTVLAFNTNAETVTGTFAHNLDFHGPAITNSGDATGYLLSHLPGGHAYCWIQDGYRVPYIKWNGFTFIPLAGVPTNNIAWGINDMITSSFGSPNKAIIEDYDSKSASPAINDVASQDLNSTVEDSGITGVFNSF